MKAPRLLFAANLVIFLTFMSPIGYIIWRFFTFSRSLSSFFESWDVFSLFFNTISLFFAVVFTSLLIGLFVSITLTRIDIKGSKVWFTLCALPLVVPSYIGALTYVSAFSPKGLFVQLLKGQGLTEIAGLDGFLGSWIVLSLFTYPYVQLICSSALRNLDVTVEEAARSLGRSRLQVYTSVVLPRLKKPIIFSGLLVGLYVISDFGAVSLMRYSTVTKAIYSYYTFKIDGDPVIFYSGLLMILALALSVLQRSTRLARSAAVSGTPRSANRQQVSTRNKILIYVLLGTLVALSLIIPVSVLSYWLIRGLSAGNDVRTAFGGVVGSFTASFVTSISAMIVATPVVIMISQYRSRLGRFIERVMLALYGLPHIAVGVSLLFISIKIFPSIYQSFYALVISYLIVFLPQAVGGGEASMEQVRRSYLDASQGLGMTEFETFRKITFPLIYRGLIAGGALVFLSTMKELPQTLLLRPTGLNTMAVDIWSYASEGLFTQAAFSSFILLAISAFPTYILSTRDLVK